MIDEDEVGLKERPEKDCQDETQSTKSVGKGLDSQLCHYWELQTQELVGLLLFGDTFLME